MSEAETLEAAVSNAIVAMIAVLPTSQGGFESLVSDKKTLCFSLSLYLSPFLCESTGE